MVVGDDADALHACSWRLMHTLAHSVTGEEDLRNFLALVRSLVHLYPCTRCAERARETYRDMEENWPDNAGGASTYEDRAVAWIIEFHNRINAHAHPGRRVPEEYADPRSECALLAHYQQYDSCEFACGGE